MGLRNWLFGQAPQVEKAELPVRSGFFTTQITPPSQMSEQIRMQNALRKSFQRGIESFKAVDSTGAPIGGVTHAMDEAYPDLSTAKMVANTGGYLPLAQLEWYAAQGFIGWQTCAILAQNWLIDKACTMPGRDAVRHGWEITSNDGEDLDPKVFDSMRKLDKRFKLKKKCIEFIKNGRIFGIRHALFIVDGIDYELPFNPDGVKPGSYRGIVQIDPYWVAPELDGNAAANPASGEFYEPTWWRVNGKRIHKTHFVIMRNGDEVTDILKPSYLYGGIPTPQKIFERVYAAERTANEAPMLAMSKRLTSIKTDVTKALANPVEFSQKMEIWASYQNNFGIKVIGEGEELQQFDTTLASLDETIMTQYQLVAAAADVPATKLLGTTPKGFNATGEYEEASYHEYLESIQENELAPLIERHHLLVIRSIIAPKMGVAPFSTEITWKPCDSPTAEEQATLNKTKAETDAILINSGAIDGFDARQRLVNDPDSGYNGMPEVVPGGPGDREHEQEMQQMMIDVPKDENDKTPDNEEASVGGEAKA
jgi:phage-related protein (TIGR01555 family)